MSASGGGDGSQPERLIARDSVNSAVNPDYPLQVAVAYDVVAFEHLSRPVSRHRHRDALGDAGADQVAHGGGPEVVGEEAEMICFSVGARRVLRVVC